MWKISLIIKIPNRIWWKVQSYSNTNFYSGFNLLKRELDIFTFKMLCSIILYWYCIKLKQIVEYLLAESYDNVHSTLTAPFETSRIFSFASSIMKNIFAFSLISSVNLSCCIAFASASSAYYLVTSIAFILIVFEIFIT